MKNLRGGEYVTPNVSLIADDNSVMFNPVPPQPITFNIQCYYDSSLNKTFNALEKMTWEQWINSGEYDITLPKIYCTGKIFIENNYILYGCSTPNYYAICYETYRGEKVKPTDIIQNGVTYYVYGEK